VDIRENLGSTNTTKEIGVWRVSNTSKYCIRNFEKQKRAVTRKGGCFRHM
jgi:hypothetical protein